MTPSTTRVDMHRHSTASAVSKLGIQRALGLPEERNPMGQATDPPGRVVTTPGRHREPVPTRAVSAGRTAALHVERKAEVEFDDFGWDALTEQARREGVSMEELLVHAAMYYVADADRQRFSHHVPWDRRSPDPSGSADKVRRRV